MKLPSVSPNVLGSVRGTLNQRSFIRISGIDRFDFLQGLTTNDVFRLNNKTINPSLYSFFLSVQGRILFDSFLYNLSSQEEILLDIHEASLSTALKYLNLYKIKRKVKIKSDSSLFAGWTDREFRDDCLVSSQDPRFSGLGYRFVSENSTDSVSLQYFDSRVRLGFPEGPEEIIPSKALPLEYNGDLLETISFKKGCYIGQELTARTFHTGVVRKRVMPLKVSSQTLEQYLINSKGKTVGKIISPVSSEGYCLGIVRIAESSDVLTFQDGTPVEVIKPHWWSQLKHS